MEFGICRQVAEIKTGVPLIEGLSLSPFSAERRGWTGPGDGDGADMAPRQAATAFRIRGTRLELLEM